MLKNWFKENKLSIIITGVLFLCSVIGWVLFVLFGHQLIEAAYEGRSIGLLNGMITGQSLHPVEYYFELANELPFQMLFLSWMVIAVIFLICLSWRKEWLEKHTNSIFIAQNG